MVTTRFDAAEYLDNPERRVEYLPAALETVDAAFIRDAASHCWQNGTATRS
jgi:DNA-binding phage protein